MWYWQLMYKKSSIKIYINTNTITSPLGQNFKFFYNLPFFPLGFRRKSLSTPKHGALQVCRGDDQKHQKREIQECFVERGDVQQAPRSKGTYTRAASESLVFDRYRWGPIRACPCTQQTRGERGVVRHERGCVLDENVPVLYTGIEVTMPVEHTLRGLCTPRYDHTDT